MNKRKALIALLMSGGLMACSTTSPITEETDKTDKTTDTSTEVVVEKPVEPEVTPEEPKVEEPVKPKPPVVETTKKTADGKLILGEEEWVFIPGLKETFKARVDTGATTSSISAVDIVPFERDGKDWVKFKIEHDGINSKELSLPVERWVKIKQSSAEGTQERAVIAAWIQIGDLKEKTEFTLADRTHLKFPLLLGRSFFRDIAVVDVGQKYVQDKIRK
ncbi:ATP-dependent zinc protease [Vibrio makurazakiensis]|uniref:ATP-dependent zinc protease family protein n=1 Tax=Vibrio makurazakiensis TaxID=2910250 RepID=UPI003D0F731F